MRHLTITVILLTAWPVPGADSASLRFMGFSTDGECFAWEQYGVQDGSGFPWSTVTIQSTADGAVIHEFSVVLEGWFKGDGDPGAESMRMASEALRELSIDGWETGSLLVHHPPTDMTFGGSSVTFCTTYYSPSYYLGDYTLDLVTVEIPRTEMEEFWGFPPLELSVRFSDNVTGLTRTVMETSDRTGNLQWVFGYSIQDVWCLGDSVFAAAIQCVSIGFEGPDLRYLMTGWTI
ncbi:MAG: DUF2259 domain-containing protein [Candidatus Fermentibacteraceae bacterium]